MTPGPALCDIRFRAATQMDQQTGLVGYVAFTLGPLRLDGITVRRTLDGRLSLSYPARKNGRGVNHPIVRPLGEQERREVEFEVFRALGLEEGGE